MPPEGVPVLREGKSEARGLPPLVAKGQRPTDPRGRGLLLAEQLEERKCEVSL